MQYFIPFLISISLKLVYEEKRKYNLTSDDKINLKDYNSIKYNEEKDESTRIIEENKRMYFLTIFQQTFIISKLIISILIFLLFILIIFIFVKLIWIIIPFVIFLLLIYLRHKCDK